MRCQSPSCDRVAYTDPNGKVWAFCKPHYDGRGGYVSLRCMAHGVWNCHHCDPYHPEEV
jgi:hypothetical protein